MGTQNVRIASPELLERATKEAEASGLTVDELASQALERELARRSYARLKRVTDARRSSLTEEQIEATVERAIQEYRTERSR